MSSLLAPGLVIFNDWVDPVTYTERPKKDGKDLILTYPPFIDYQYYNWEDNSWSDGYVPFVLKVNGRTATDLTQYGKLVPRSPRPYTVTGKPYYWLEKNVLHTNIDFDNYMDSEMVVEATYQYIVTSVKVKIVMRANKGDMSIPPSVDWYAIDIGGEDRV